MTLRTDEVVYRRVGGTDLSAYVVHPEADAGPVPALLLFHGGSWRSGHPFGFLPHCHYFASRGMVTASASYRLLGKNTDDIRDCVEDAAAAVQWLRGLDGVDGTRVAAGGHSAGGHLAACTGLVPPRDPTLSQTRPDALLLLNPAVGAVAYGTHKVIDEVSPSSHIAPGAPPTLIVYGTRDFLRPFMLPFAESMIAAGNRVDLVSLDGAHNVVHPPARKRDEYIAAIRPLDDFLVSLGHIQPADVAAHVDSLDLFEILGGRSESVDPRKTRPRRSRPAEA